MGGKRLTKSEKKKLKRTTTKTQRQAMKSSNRAEVQKTREQRHAEIQQIKDDLTKWGCTQQFQPIVDLYARMDAFLETGQNDAGQIAFPEAPPQPQGRMIVYTFNNRASHKASVNLMVRDGQSYALPSSGKGKVKKSTATPMSENPAGRSPFLEE